MRNILAGIFKVLGVIVFAIFGLLGFIIELGILNQVIGYWGSVIAFVLFPITFTVAPWYALIARGNWSPLVIVCGGGILANFLMLIEDTYGLLMRKTCEFCLDVFVISRCSPLEVSFTR